MSRNTSQSLCSKIPCGVPRRDRVRLCQRPSQGVAMLRISAIGAYVRTDGSPN